MTNLPVVLASMATTGLLALGGPALASHGAADGRGDDNGGGGNGGRVVKTGTCSDGAHWKLKVKSDNSRLQVEGEVDSNRSGQTWKWKIKDNGSVAARGTATTRGRSGSFSVERRIADQAGTDKVVFRARHAGQLCKGTIGF